MNLEILGTIIRTKRKALGLTQEELGIKLGVSKTAVSKWERGLNYPDIQLHEEISRILGISLPCTFQSLITNETELKMEANRKTETNRKMPKLTSIHTMNDYLSLCEQIFQTFKDAHPDYRDPILYMVHEIILHAIGDTIYNNYGNEEDCDYAAASCLVADCFSFDNVGREGHYVNNLDHNLYNTGGELFEDFPEPDLDDQAVEAFYNGKTGIGQTSHKAGYNVLNFLIKYNHTYDGYIRREIKDNGFISELQIAFMQLEDLLESY